MNTYTMEDVTFTAHILERFVERTMNKTGNEMKQYLAQNEQFVKEKLLLLYNSAELLWSGKIREHNFTHFYINKDGWIIIVDKEGKKLITVYKADLDLGSDFNKMYVERIKETVSDINKQLEEKEKELSYQKEESKRLIELLQQENVDLKEKVEYNTIKINSLKESDEIATREYNQLEKELQHRIEKFINAKVF